MFIQENLVLKECFLPKLIKRTSEMEDLNSRAKIVDLIKTKLTTKREVFEKTKAVFSSLKKVLKLVQQDLQEKTKAANPIAIEIAEFGEYEIRMRVGGDTIVFLMHSNVFDFEQGHRTLNNSYVKADPFRSLCGQIYVYNFLSDSFKYNRPNDLGYLMARIFVNKDLHYYVDGEQKLSFLFNDFVNAVLDEKALSCIIEQVLIHCLEFDLYTPPYKQVSMVTVDAINQTSNERKLQTGKRLGFKFKADKEVK